MPDCLSMHSHAVESGFPFLCSRSCSGLLLAGFHPGHPTGIVLGGTPAKSTLMCPVALSVLPSLDLSVALEAADPARLGRSCAGLLAHPVPRGPEEAWARRAPAPHCQPKPVPQRSLSHTSSARMKFSVTILDPPTYIAAGCSDWCLHLPPQAPARPCVDV